MHKIMACDVLVGKSFEFASVLGEDVSGIVQSGAGAMWQSSVTTMHRQMASPVWVTIDGSAGANSVRLRWYSRRRVRLRAAMPLMSPCGILCHPRLTNPHPGTLPPNPSYMRHASHGMPQRHPDQGALDDRES